MTRLVIDVLLAIVVLAAWLGCVGFARLRSALDRIHCVAFVNATSGAALTVAAFVADGLSVRALKILLIVGLSLLTGAAMSHATGRALLLRGSAPEADQGASGHGGGE
ncbi:MAG: monovalent cation/H(+) antiporter subunit G [Pseudomonadota bacterium]|nr:monovalent cation/H(+) antiporter subunit G [Pseudomonadota bacterium]